MKRRLILLLVLLMPAWAQATEVYQAPDQFLAETFDGDIPPPQALWVSGDVKAEAAEILGHDFGSLRVRYWRLGDRTAWILEEIGKHLPITTGFVVRSGEIERVKVLIYRESRGFEVRYPFFTDQFKGAHLADERRLDRSIDSISGATLSVNALTRLARLALFFHQQVVASDG